MVLFQGIEYATGTERLVSVSAPIEQAWFDESELRKFYTSSYAAAQWRSETVAALLEFGVDDESGWAYRVFRQPAGQSVRSLVHTNGVFSPKAACRVAAVVTRVQQEAMQLGMGSVDFGMHQVYYHYSGRDETISILGLGLGAGPKRYPHLPPPPHPTAVFLRTVLCAAQGPRSCFLPEVQPDGTPIPEGIRRLYHALSTEHSAAGIKDPGTLIASLESLERGDEVPYDILPALPLPSQIQSIYVPIDAVDTRAHVETELHPVPSAAPVTGAIDAGTVERATLGVVVSKKGLMPSEDHEGQGMSTTAANTDLGEAPQSLEGISSSAIHPEVKDGLDEASYASSPGRALVWGIVVGALVYSVYYIMFESGLLDLF
jgi:hypothetical protein